MLSFGRSESFGKAVLRQVFLVVRFVSADKSKLIKVVIGLLVWVAVIVGIGCTIGKKPAKTMPIAKSSEESRQDIQNDNSSSSAKSQKLASLNLQAVLKGMKKTETILGVSDWEKPISKARDGIPALQVYFPQGQSIDGGWQESFVLRSFINIAIANPYPVVYEVYAAWLKEQIPDIQLTKEQDSSGIYFQGQSKSQNLYIVGKVYSGAVKETIHIGQYAVKDSSESTQDKITQWKANFSKIK